MSGRRRMVGFAGALIYAYLGRQIAKDNGIEDHYGNIGAPIFVIVD